MIFLTLYYHVCMLYCLNAVYCIMHILVHINKYSSLQEILCIIPGLLYFLAIPAMSMLMFLYSIGNLHVVSWGTREATPDTEVKKSTNKHKPEKDEKGYFCSLGDFFGYFWHCLQYFLLGYTYCPFLVYKLSIFLMRF